MPGVPVLAARHIPVQCWDAGTMRDLGVDALRGLKLFAFAGIGAPDGFRQTLEETGAVEAGFAPFADHHRYTAEEAAELIMQAEHNGLALLTTEKDHARMIGEPLLEALASRAHTLGVTMFVKEADELLRLLRSKLRR